MVSTYVPPRDHAGLRPDLWRSLTGPPEADYVTDAAIAVDLTPTGCT
jgi:hypothetical protein